MSAAAAVSRLASASTSRSLRAVESALPEDFARRHLRTGRQLVEAKKRAPSESARVTGCAELDAVLGGGLARGQLTELVGTSSSGRFSLLQSLLATATAEGHGAALIDMGDALDPQNALGAGVVLERLLWVRPRHLKETLLSAEIVIATGMPVVVIDLGVPPLAGGRGHEASWLRLARAAQDQRSTLVVASPYRVSGTSAHSVVQVRRRRAVWSGRGAEPRLLHQLDSALELVKGPDAHTARRQALVMQVAQPIAAPKVQPSQPKTQPAAELGGKPSAPRPRREPAHRSSQARAIA